MDSKPGLIKLSEALDIVCRCASPMPAMHVSLIEAFGRILADDVFAPTDIPPFNKSAMDGFAIRRADIARPLTVMGTIAAGQAADVPLTPGGCFRIMTGAKIPPLADCVVMKEDVTETEPGIIRITNQESKTNICLCGEDIRQGSLVMEQGSRIGAPQMALLALLGISNPRVYIKPKVVVYATGNELTEPGYSPSANQIFNSNSYQLLGQVRQTGIEASYGGIISDDCESLRTAIEVAANRFNLILLTGGVSAGDFDLMPEVLRQCGFTLHFRHIAIQPGKPMVFAQRNHTFCFALSGNPVSSYIQAQLLVIPFIYHTMGHKFKPFNLSGKISSSYKRKKTERDAFVPVYYHEGTIDLIPNNGSAHIEAYNRANAMLCIPAGVCELQKDETVYVRPL